MFADFGDYADTSFSCPALTTCPVICSKKLSECPTTCPENLTLCLDGTCKASCTGFETNKCEELYACTPYSCPKVDLDFDSCLLDYELFYNVSHSCPANMYDDESKDAFTLPLVLFYSWILFISSCLIGWGRFNYMRFIQFSIKKDDSVFLNERINGQDQKRQIAGYKRNHIGTLLKLVTSITWWSFQAGLFALTVMFYQYNDVLPQTDVMPFGVEYESEEEILFSFEVIWFVGFFWSFWIALIDHEHFFLIHCDFDEAEYVAVLTAEESDRNDDNFSSKNQDKSTFFSFQYISIIHEFTAKVYRSCNYLVGICFSNPDKNAKDGSFKYCPVVHEQLNNVTDVKSIRSFYFKLRRYVYSSNAETFIPNVNSIESSRTIGDLISIQEGGGLTDVLVSEMLHKSGRNLIHLEKPSLFLSIVNEFNKSFYLYQNFLIWAWFPLWFYYIAILHTVVRVIGGLTVAYFSWQNDCNLHQLGQVFGEVEVLRDYQVKKIPQSDLVPGDVVVLTKGITYADMVAITANNVLVDESALTGEVTPVSKVQLDPAESDKTYDVNIHKKSTISAGTNIIESSEDGKDFAVVTKTGSFTAKGELLRDILSYKRHRFKFDIEIEIVVLILAAYAAICLGFVLYLLNDDPVYGWFYGMYVVGTALPPLLPTVFVVSVGVSENRLTKNRIASTDSQNILVAGKVSVAFFDKTGTLTKQGLSFLSTMSGSNWNLNEPELATDEMLRSMAVTHTLTKSLTGDIIGNAVDQCMFNETGATLDVMPNRPLSVIEKNGSVLFVVKRFDFNHTTMTQAVIVKDEEGAIFGFVKGSQESIKRICDHSSLPDDYDDITNKCSRQGIYQIAVAKVKLISPNVDVMQISRAQMEQNLDFLGFINFKNVLKNETPEVIRELDCGNIQSYMITGDSLFTGINIARECGMIKSNKRVIHGSDIDMSGNVVWFDNDDGKITKLPLIENLADIDNDIELAVTGEVWNTLLLNSPEHATELAKYIRIYGRCTPSDKVSVVSEFVKMGFITLMCGDGGNDCGALKTAHVGVALSKAEASIVSPFTSLDLDLKSVVEVLKEGRCALTSAFASYKYMIMYGQIETFTQILCAYYRITFADWNWTFMDGIWLTTLAFSLTLAQPADRLAEKRPTASLLGPQTLSSIIGMLIINNCFTLLGLFSLLHTDWYSCRTWIAISLSNVLRIGDNYESEIIFLLSGYQYISSAMAFNFGHNHRASWYTNKIFVFFATLWTLLHFTVTLFPGKLSCMFRVNCVNEDVVPGLTDFEKSPLNNPYNMTLMPLDFRWLLISFMTVNAALNLCWNYYVVYGTIGQRLAIAYKTRIKNMSSSIPNDLYLKAETEERVVV